MPQKLRETMGRGEGFIFLTDKLTRWVSAQGLMLLLREPASFYPRTAVLRVALSSAQESSRISRCQVLSPGSHKGRSR